MGIKRGAYHMIEHRTCPLRLTITDPSETPCIIELFRHFSVEGTITHEGELHGDDVLVVELLDKEGERVRHAISSKKGNRNIFTDTPLLKGYPKGMDDDWEKLKRYGFPPLLVKDPAKAEDSIHDATIKCWYDDSSFKAIIITASDVPHGLIFDDYMHFTDEKGNPYSFLKEGNYTIRVTLSTRSGEVLASTQKPILIAHHEDVAIIRFNPIAHKKRMESWCKENHIHVLVDLVPGYLEPYLGVWYYHMGILPMYLASDVTQYVHGHVHLFIYLMEKSSTSYSTELAYLEKRGDVENPLRLSVYHYDIGEAELGGRKASIMLFGKDEFLWVCRIDRVTKEAKEGCYDPKAVVESLTHKEKLTLFCGEPFAIMGVLRPWQFDKEDLELLGNNSYLWKNEIDAILYEFDDGEKRYGEQRKVGLKRAEGDSVLEFLHIFTLSHSGIYSLTLTAIDRHGRFHTGAKERLQLEVIPSRTTLPVSDALP